MKKLMSIIFGLCSIGANAQCDLSAQTILSMMNCDSIALHCPSLGGSGGDPNDEIQVLSLAGNIVSLSLGGGSFALPASSDDQTLSYDPATKRLTIEDGNFVDLDEVPNFTVIDPPVLTTAGDVSLDVQQTLETDRYWYTQFDGDCREHYVFEMRVRGEHLTTGGWGRLIVPNIGGWDRNIEEVTMYRFAGNINNDDGQTGAMGDAPIMASELKEWSNSGQIYLNQVDDRDNDYLFWIDIQVEYKRN